MFFRNESANFTYKRFIIIEEKKIIAIENLFVIRFMRKYCSSSTVELFFESLERDGCSHYYLFFICEYDIYFDGLYVFFVYVLEIFL